MKRESWDGILTLKPGREKSVLRCHPWIFSGSVGQVSSGLPSGATVSVQGSEGSFLARAAFSPHSSIQARIWSWDSEQAIDEQFFRDRLALAQRQRETWTSRWDVSKDAYRLVHAESDGLPGLIVDRYADILVAQFLSAGAEYWREIIADLLIEAVGIETVFERSDVDVRSLEGLSPRSGPLRGQAPPERVKINEHGLAYWVDVYRGHKTGFYLDQGENRQLVSKLAAGRHVLDCFAYTGGFSIAALAGGAETITAVESSAEAIDLAQDNLKLNQLPAEKAEWIQGDAFHVLRAFRDSNRKFDLVILDPPKFARTASQAQRAARGYKDINLLAFKLLRPGGLLVTFSCSGGVSPDLFQKIVAGAALDAGVRAQVHLRLAQGPDHPVALNFPEGAYLKGLVCQIA